MGSNYDGIIDTCVDLDKDFRALAFGLWPLTFVTEVATKILNRRSPRSEIQDQKPKVKDGRTKAKD